MDEEDARSPEGRGLNGEPGTLSPVPPKPINDSNKVRHSLDGETIFAVGEDGDKWSEDDDSPRVSSERQKLTSKND